MNTATIRLMSQVLFMPTDVTVLLPERPAAPNERFKTLWLLHGACGDHRTYLYTAELEQIVQQHNVVIIMPSALNSDYGSYAQFGTGYNFAAYFFEELMPFVFATFPVSDRREDNYIEGASMGGYGAMSLGLLHPERFAAIGMLGASLRESAFLKPYEDWDALSFRKLALSDPTAFPTEYGPPGQGIKLKEVNVITKYPTVKAFLDSPECMWRRFPEVVKKGLLPQIYVACGTEDLFYAPTLRFQALVEELGVTDSVHFHIAEGVGHDGAFFDRQIAAFADYYAL